MLFLLKRFDEAHALISEALRLYHEIGIPSLMFGSRLLAAKIDHALGKQAQAITLLSDLLTQAETPEQEADMHYALYECGVERETHRQAALQLYQELYAKTPKFLWKKRMTELASCS